MLPRPATLVSSRRFFKVHTLQGFKNRNSWCHSSCLVQLTFQVASCKNLSNLHLTHCLFVLPDSGLLLSKSFPLSQWPYPCCCPYSSSSPRELFLIPRVCNAQSFGRIILSVSQHSLWSKPWSHSTAGSQCVILNPSFLCLLPLSYQESQSRKNHVETFYEYKKV